MNWCLRNIGSSKCALWLVFLQLHLLKVCIYGAISWRYLGESKKCKEVLQEKIIAIKNKQGILGNSKNQSDVSKACIRLAVSADREEQGWQSLPQGEKMVKWQGNK